MNNDTDVQNALVNIAKTLATAIMGQLKYDFHFKGYIVSKNDNGTFDVQSDEKNGVLHGIRHSTNIEPVVGDYVQIRETKNVQNSYLIDYIER